MRFPSRGFADLHAAVVDETAALATRLVDARSIELARQLDEARTAFAAAAALAASALSAPAFADDQLRSVKEQLASLPGFDSIRLQLAEQEEANQHLNAALITAHAGLDELRDELRAEQARAEAARAELSHVTGEFNRTLEDTRQEQQARQDADAVRNAELTTAHAGLEELRDELRAEQARAEAARAELSHMTGEFNRTLEDTRQEQQARQADADAVRGELQAERERVEAARSEIARMTVEFDNTLEEIRQEHVAMVGEQRLAYSSLPLDALLTVFSGLQRCATLDEVLTNLVAGLGREFSRVALFEIQGGHLQGVQQVGFDFDGTMGKVAISLSGDSLVSRAARSGRLETLVGGQDTEPATAMPFAGTPACAIAAPIFVQGKTVAIVYADDSDNSEFGSGVPQARAKFAELLQAHVLLVLLRVEVEQKRLTELRDFVTLLVDEIEYAHLGDIDAGKNPLERQRDLRAGLERSRRMYEERAEKCDPDVMEECLNAVMETRGQTVFGRDLESVRGPGATPRRAPVVAIRR